MTNFLTRFIYAVVALGSAVCIVLAGAYIAAIAEAVSVWR